MAGSDLSVSPPRTVPAKYFRLVESARGFRTASRSKATQRAHASDLADFHLWCAENGETALPAEPAVLGLYVTALAERGLAIATIRRRLVSISVAHKKAGIEPTPCAHPEVREIVTGIARTYGSAQVKKTALTAADLATIVGNISETSKGIRDRALLLAGFAGVLRRSELVALTVEDLRFEPEGVVLHLRRSKTDQEGRGADVAIPYGRRAKTCPVRALQKLLERGEFVSGPVFRPISRGGRFYAEALSGNAVSEIVQHYAAAISDDASLYGGHSLRSGYATSAIRAGAQEHRVMRQGRWKSRAVFDGYVRDAARWDEHPGSLVDL